MTPATAHAIWLIAEILMGLFAILATIGMIRDVRASWPSIKALFKEIENEQS